MARIAVVGGGIAGLAAALFLGRRGHDVHVFEQERRRPGGGLDRDFFDWHRPRVPQAMQPHGFLSPVRTVLSAEAPDVYEDMLAMGAWEQHEFDWFPEHPAYRPGDEDLVLIRARRIVVETALSVAVGRQKGVTWHQGERVEGLLVDSEGAVARVWGVRTPSGTFEADLVIDAGGRRSRMTEQLIVAGGRGPVVENHRTGLAYFCRWYRLQRGAPANVGRVPYSSASSYALSIAFPSDNGVFGVALALRLDDPTLPALRDPGVFDGLVRLFPSTGAWLALAPEPVGDVYAMSGLDNRWTALADEEGPVVAGLVGVGDAVLHTNPTLTQGLALTMRTAQRVAVTADRLHDPLRFAREHHLWALHTLKPWFDHQVATDRANEVRLGRAGQSEQLDSTALEQAARFPCALDDPLVMRAWAQARHLLRTPAEAFASDEVRARIAHWLTEHPGFTPGGHGPSRSEWEALIASRV